MRLLCKKSHWLLVLVLSLHLCLPATAAQPPGGAGLRYPVLFVHGVGSFDAEDAQFSYWGDIPAVFRAQGVQVFFGEQGAWSPIETNALALGVRVRAILKQTGAQKINIIAHSKGGLDARYMISALGMGNQVASLTTISTPHHGSKTMDVILRLPEPVLQCVGFGINTVYAWLGDSQPNAYACVQQFSTRYMQSFNQQTPDAPQVYYQSYAAAMRSPLSDAWFALPFVVVGRLEGESDGLVSIASAQWTNFKGVWRGADGQGVSHVDSTDMHRRRFALQGGQPDMLAVYNDLLADLRQRGY